MPIYNEPIHNKKGLGGKVMEIKYLANCPEYVEQVVNWIYGEFVVKGKNPCHIEKVNEHFSHTNTNSFPITLVALVNDQCVGTVSLFENDLKNQKALTPWLASLYVDVPYRSKGIAKKLIEQVKEIAKEMGFEVLYLRTEHTAGYYRDLGWTYHEKTIDEKGQETEIFKIEL